MQETGNSKIITMAFVAFGFLVALVIQVLFENLAVSFAPVARLHSNEMIRHALPIVGFVLTFGLMQFNAKVRVWADECVSEVKRVVWPSRKDTIAMTMVCCVMVTVVGIGLGAFDFFAQYFLKTFVNLSVFH